MRCGACCPATPHGFRISAVNVVNPVAATLVTAKPQLPAGTAVLYLLEVEVATPLSVVAVVGCEAVPSSVHVRLTAAPLTAVPEAEFVTVTVAVHL
uniref:Uncharacterized protein n=1 Tax=Tetradesmus obliquus TaxID=3088 RepID=A0A383W6H9_TETOB